MTQHTTNANERGEPIGLFIPNKDLEHLYKTVASKSRKWMDSIMSPSEPFRLLPVVMDDFPELRNHPDIKRDLFTRICTTAFDRFPQIFTTRNPATSVKVYGRSNHRRAVRSVDASYLDVSSPWYPKYKVFMPRTCGSFVQFGEQLAPCIIGNPGDICTCSYIVVGQFETEEEAHNCDRYLHSKFARALWSIRHISPQNCRNRWDTVPLVDFGPNSPIDWDKEIDVQLCALFACSPDEIALIERCQ